MKLAHLVDPVYEDCIVVMKDRPIAETPKAINHGESGLLFMHELLDTISKNRAYDDQHPCFSRGYWKRVLPCDNREYCFYYVDGANDDHLNTLLRAVKKKLQENNLL
jgi:hypothetical protein